MGDADAVARVRFTQIAASAQLPDWPRGWGLHVVWPEWLRPPRGGRSRSRARAVRVEALSARHPRPPQAFVEHYYRTFDQNRSALAGLYTDQSIMTFQSQKFQGQHQIVEKLTQVRGAPCGVECLSCFT